MNIGVAIISPHLSRWHWLKVFCKDNRLVLIEECLFAEASSANAGAWALEALPSSPGVIAHLHLKQHTQNQRVWAHTLKVAILTSYKNLSVGYSELKFHIYALGTSDTYFTSCKKGHNRSPLRYFWWNPRAFWHRTQMCCVLFTSRGMHMLWYCRERASKSNTEENNLLNKVIIFVYLHTKSILVALYSRTTDVTWTILTMSLLRFWVLNVSVALLSMQVRKLSDFIKNILMHSEDEQMSYRCGTTWWWVNKERIFIFEWTIPLTILNCLDNCLWWVNVSITYLDLHVSIANCSPYFRSALLCIPPLLSTYLGLVKIYMHFPLCIYHPPNTADRISESLTGALEQILVLRACLGRDKKSWMLTCFVLIGFWEWSWRRNQSKVLSTCFVCGIASFIEELFWPD